VGRQEEMGACGRKPVCDNHQNARTAIFGGRPGAVVESSPARAWALLVVLPGLAPKRRLERPMTDEELRERIVSDPKVMVGQPCIRGTRLTVRYIVNLLAHGTTIEEILTEYYRLTREDVLACLLYAADVLESHSGAALASPR
jgi:uncharacterized protein (DUF433 family)